MSFCSQAEVVIDKPLLPAEYFGFNDGSLPQSLYTSERYLPKILVEIGFFKSNSEVRKNRSDLVRILDKPDLLEIKVSKKNVWILVGLTEEGYNAYEELENGNN